MEAELHGYDSKDEAEAEAEAEAEEEAEEKVDASGDKDAEGKDQKAGKEEEDKEGTTEDAAIQVEDDEGPTDEEEADYKKFREDLKEWYKAKQAAKKEAGEGWDFDTWYGKNPTPPHPVTGERWTPLRKRPAFSRCLPKEMKLETCPAEWKWEKGHAAEKPCKPETEEGLNAFRATLAGLKECEIEWFPKHFKKEGMINKSDRKKMRKLNKDIMDEESKKEEGNKKKTEKKAED